MDLRDALIDWDEPADEGSNTSHIAEHGLTPEEVETALFDENTTFDVSDSSGRPIAFGATGTGRVIVGVFDGLNLADVAERMGIDAPALSRLETGKMLNPTLATLHKWAEALGQKLDVDLSSGTMPPEEGQGRG